MKKIVLLTILNLYLSISFSQNLKKKSNNKDGFIETYYVDKTNNQIREGDYFLKYSGDILIKGNYKANIKTGVWEVYGYRNLLELSYDYDSSIVKYYKFPSEEIDYSKINRPPICMIGFWNLRILSQLKAKFPKDFTPLDNLRLKVTIGFTIDSVGNPIDFYLLESSGHLNFDRQALTDIKETVLGENWLPALDKNNNAISYDLKISLTYLTN